MGSRRVSSRSWGGGTFAGGDGEDEGPVWTPGPASRSYLLSVRPETRSTFCSIIAQLTEETQPTFETTLKSRAVSMDSDVRFTCVVTGYPEPEVTWYKDDVELDRYCGLPKYQISQQGNRHTLQLYRCQEEDAAIYQASARNTKGIVSCSGVLEVGPMTEYRIHQRWFSRIKHKAAARLREMEQSWRQGPEASEADSLRKLSPDRFQRKRRLSGPGLPLAPRREEEDEAAGQQSSEDLTLTDSFAPGEVTTNGEAAPENGEDGEHSLLTYLCEAMERGPQRAPQKTAGAKKKKKAEQPRPAPQKLAAETTEGHNTSPDCGPGVDGHEPQGLQSCLEAEKGPMGPARGAPGSAATESAGKPGSGTGPWVGTQTAPVLTRVPGLTPAPAPARTPGPVPAPSPRPSQEVYFSLKDLYVESTQPAGPGDKAPGEMPPGRAPSQSRHGRGPASGQPASSLAPPPARPFNRRRFAPPKPSSASGAPLPPPSPASAPSAPGPVKGPPQTSAPAPTPPARRRHSARDAPPQLPADPRALGQVQEHQAAGTTLDSSWTLHVPTRLSTDGGPDTETQDNGWRVGGLQDPKMDGTVEVAGRMPEGTQENKSPETERSCPADRGGRTGTWMEHLAERTPDRRVEEEERMQDRRTQEEERKQDRRTQEEERKQDRRTQEEERKQDRRIQEEERMQDRRTQEERMQDRRIQEEERMQDRRTQGERIQDRRKQEEERLQDRRTQEEERLQDRRTQEEERMQDRRTQEEERKQDRRTQEEERLPDRRTREEERMPDRRTQEEERTQSQGSIPTAGKGSWEDRLVSTGIPQPRAPELPSPEDTGSPAMTLRVGHTMEGSLESPSLLLRCAETAGMTPVDPEGDRLDTLLGSPESLGGKSHRGPKQPEEGGRQGPPEAQALGQSAGESPDPYPPREPAAPYPLRDSPALSALQESAAPSPPGSGLTGHSEGQPPSTRASPHAHTSLTPRDQAVQGSDPSPDPSRAASSLGEACEEVSGGRPRSCDPGLIDSLKNYLLLLLKLSGTQLSGEPAGPPGGAPLVVAGLSPRTSRRVLEGAESDRLVPSARSLLLSPATSRRLTDLLDREVQAGRQALDKARGTPAVPTIVVGEGGGEGEGNAGPRGAPRGLPAATPQELALGARRKRVLPRVGGDREPGLEESQSPASSPRAPRKGLAPSSPGTPSQERCSPTQDRRASLLEVPRVEHEPTAEPSGQEEPAKPRTAKDLLQAPQVIRKIRVEQLPDASGSLKLWCQFFNILSDSVLTWAKDRRPVGEVGRSAGDEGPAALAVVQAAAEDCGVYRCTIRNEHGTASTDFCLSPEVLSGFISREEGEVGEEIEMTPMVFAKGLADSGCWGDKLFGRLVSGEPRACGRGLGLRKASLAKVIYGLEPVFESGRTCVIKVSSLLVFGPSSEMSLLGKNYDVTIQACKIQNMSREYCKIFAAEARAVPGFGEVPEIVPLYLIYRPASTIPYATLEEDLGQPLQPYCSRELDTTPDPPGPGAEAKSKCHAFQHWLYQWTNGGFLVTDLAGADWKLTDVQIATRLRGYQGLKESCFPALLDQFTVSHKCNAFCEMLGLRPLRGPEAAHPPTKAKGSKSPSSGRKGPQLSPQPQKRGPPSPQGVRKSSRAGPQASDIARPCGQPPVQEGVPQAQSPSSP